MVGKTHKFNHAVLAPQYQRNADGSTVEVGAKPGVDVYSGEKFLRLCGAVTNLMLAAESLVTGWRGPTLNVALSTRVTDGPGGGVRTVSVITTTTDNAYAHTSIRPALADTAHFQSLWVRGITAQRTTFRANYIPDFSYRVDIELTGQWQKIEIPMPPRAGVTGARIVFDTRTFGAAYTGEIELCDFIITATAYPVPYVPPGVTQPASNATATNGAWFSNPDGSPLWYALDGQADGIELANISSTVSILNTAGSSGVYNPATNTLSNTAVGANNSHPRFRFSMGPKTVGARYRCHIEFSDTSVAMLGSNTSARLSTSSRTQYLTKNGNVYSGIITADNTESVFEIVTNGTALWSMQIISATIQRIQPQPLTLATRIRMGVGSGDLPNSATFLPIISEKGDAAATVQRYYKDANTRHIVVARDGTGTAFFGTNIAWPRDSIIRRVTQVNAAGTQFRVGYMIEGTHTAIQWGSWVAYDGSFDPSTLYRLMLGFNNPYPMWYNKISIWKEQVSDERILEALS